MICIARSRRRRTVGKKSNSRRGQVMVSLHANNWCKAFSFLGFLLHLLDFNNNNHRCHAAAATTAAAAAAAASLIDNYDAHNLSGRGLKGEAEENNSVVCTTEDQCKEKFLSMGTGGAFLVGEYPTKGCFSKNSNVYFGTGAMVEEELAVTDLPGIQERIWCDKEPDHANNSENPSANPTQVPPAEFIPTRQPATQVLEPTASLSSDDGVNVDIGTVTGIPSTAVICSQDQCREKFLGLAISSEDGGRFIVGDFPTKGCFSKKSNVYYSTGSASTIAELAENDLPGAQTRIWCQRETESPTLKPPSARPKINHNPTIQPTTTKSPATITLTPSTTAHPIGQPTSNPMTLSPTSHPSQLPIILTKQPTQNPTSTMMPSSARPKRLTGVPMLTKKTAAFQPVVVTKAEEEQGAILVVVVGSTTSVSQQPTLPSISKPKTLTPSTTNPIDSSSSPTNHPSHNMMPIVTNQPTHRNPTTSSGAAANRTSAPTNILPTTYSSSPSAALPTGTPASARPSSSDLPTDISPTRTPANSSSAPAPTPKTVHSSLPTGSPTSASPTNLPTDTITFANPSSAPTNVPSTASQSILPSDVPTVILGTTAANSSSAPTKNVVPTAASPRLPTTRLPSSDMPTDIPTSKTPSSAPTNVPTTKASPSSLPSKLLPTDILTSETPSSAPTNVPTTESPSNLPTDTPTSASKSASDSSTTSPTSANPSSAAALTKNAPSNLSTSTPILASPTDLPKKESHQTTSSYLPSSSRTTPPAPSDHPTFSPTSTDAPNSQPDLVADSTGDVADAKVIENLALDSTAPDKSAPRNEHYYWLWVLSSSVFGVGLVLVAMKVFYTPRRQSSAGRKEGDDKVATTSIRTRGGLLVQNDFSNPCVIVTAYPGEAHEDDNRFEISLQQAEAGNFQSNTTTRNGEEEEEDEDENEDEDEEIIENHHIHHCGSNRDVPITIITNQPRQENHGETKTERVDKKKCDTHRNEEIIENSVVLLGGPPPFIEAPTGILHEEHTTQQGCLPCTYFLDYTTPTHIAPYVHTGIIGQTESFGVASLLESQFLESSGVFHEDGSDLCSSSDDNTASIQSCGSLSVFPTKYQIENLPPVDLKCIENSSSADNINFVQCGLPSGTLSVFVAAADSQESSLDRQQMAASIKSDDHLSAALSVFRHHVDLSAVPRSGIDDFDSMIEKSLPSGTLSVFSAGSQETT